MKATCLVFKGFLNPLGNLWSLLIAIFQSKTQVYLNLADLSSTMTGLLVAGNFDGRELCFPKLCLVLDPEAGAIVFFLVIDLIHMNLWVRKRFRFAVNLLTNFGVCAYK